MAGSFSVNSPLSRAPRSSPMSEARSSLCSSIAFFIEAKPAAAFVLHPVKGGVRFPHNVVGVFFVSGNRDADANADVEVEIVEDERLLETGDDPFRES